jgi:hypothetical protein
MIFVQMLDRSTGQLWLIPLGRVLGFTTVEEHGVVYAVAMVDGLSNAYWAPIPNMFRNVNQQDTSNIPALARWIDSLLNGPRGVNRG